MPMTSLEKLAHSQVSKLVYLANKQLHAGKETITYHKQKLIAEHFMMHMAEGQEFPDVMIKLQMIGAPYIIIRYATTEYAELVQNIEVLRYLSVINTHQRQNEFFREQIDTYDKAHETFQENAVLIVWYVQKIVELGETVIVEKSIEGEGHLYYTVKEN